MVHVVSFFRENFSFCLMFRKAEDTASSVLSPQLQKDKPHSYMVNKISFISWSSFKNTYEMVEYNNVGTVRKRLKSSVSSENCKAMLTS